MKLIYLLYWQLSGCSKITDEGVEVLAENLHQLKSLGKELLLKHIKSHGSLL